MAWILGVGVTLAAATSTAVAQHAHRHGVMQLAVAIEGEQLTIALQAPLESLLGFERAPRTDAERRAAADVLARLRGGGGLFTPEAAARCTLSTVDVRAGVLDARGAASPAGDHADLEADYVFRCLQPAALRRLDTALFAAFGRLQRIEVQVAGPQGQRRADLTRPNGAIPLTK